MIVAYIPATFITHWFCIAGVAVTPMQYLHIYSIQITIPKTVEIGPSGRGGTLLQNITTLHNIACVRFFRVITFRCNNRSDPAKAKLSDFITDPTYHK
jgi:hypothetical protein